MTKCFTVVFGLSLLILFGATPGWAQGTSSEVEDLKEEIGTLREGQKEIQKELQEIKSLLRTRQAPAPSPAPAPREVVLDVEGNPFKGDRNARLTLIEFTDYQ